MFNYLLQAVLLFICFRSSDEIRFIHEEILKDFKLTDIWAPIEYILPRKKYDQTKEFDRSNWMKYIKGNI